MSSSAEGMEQAKKDLEYAVGAQKQGDFEWSCLAAHHAAEKALKSALSGLGRETKGHLLTKLCYLLGTEITLIPGVLDSAKRLDNFYVRFGQVEGEDLREDAERAVQDAIAITRFCERL